MEEVKCYYNSPVSLAQAEKYIEASLVTTAREYVAIGHWLRRIRDDKLFQEEGYRNFEEYVRQKYHKDAGWASKCIKVNAQFSVGGNSPHDVTTSGLRICFIALTGVSGPTSSRCPSDM